MTKYKYTPSIPAIIIIIFFSNPSYSQLPEIILKSISNNNKIIAAKSALKASKENLKQAYALYLPNFTATTSGSWERDSSTTSDVGRVADITNSRDVAVSVSQKLWQGGKRKHEFLEVKNNINSEISLLNALVQSEILSSATKYSDYYRKTKILSQKKKNEFILNKHLKEAETRFTLGEFSQTDYFQAKSRYANAQAELIKANGELKISDAKFTDAFGSLREKEIKLKILPINANSLDILLKQIQKDNFNISSNRYLKLSAKNTYNKNLKSLWPTLSLTGSYTHNLESVNRKSESRILTGKLNLTMPLYSGGSNYSSIRQTKYTISQRTYLLDDIVKSKILEGTSTWYAFKTSESRITALTAEISAAEIALNAIKKEANVGTKPFIDVLDAEQVLLNSRVALINEEHELLLSSFKLNDLTAELNPQIIPTD
jgi:outer membrane protein